MKKITVKAEYGNKLAEQGKLDEWQRSAHPYTVTVKHNGRQLTIPFFMGSALTHEPTDEDVMPSLLMDYSLVQSDDFEDFCANLGYDNDSRTAHDMFIETKKIAKKVERVFGSSIDKLQEKYL